MNVSKGSLCRNIQVVSPRGAVDRAVAIAAGTEQATYPFLTFQCSDSYKDALRNFAEKFGPLSRHTEVDLRLRALLVLHTNDILSPLLPLVSPGYGETAKNHPSELLQTMRGYVFAQVLVFFLQLFSVPVIIEFHQNSGQVRILFQVRVSDAIDFEPTAE